MVWDLLAGAIEARPLHPAEEGEDLPGAYAAVCEAVTVLEEGFDRFQRQRLTRDESNPRVKAWLDEEEEQRSAALDAKQRERDTLASRFLRAQQHRAAASEFRKVMHFFQATLTDNEKRETVEQIVERILVHLEEGWFEVMVNTSLLNLPHLVGRLDGGDHEVGERDEAGPGDTPRGAAMAASPFAARVAWTGPGS